MLHRRFKVQTGVYTFPLEISKLLLTLNYTELYQDSNHSTYAKMWQFMQENPTMMVASNEEGVARVMSHDEDYAFLMESTSISYEAQRKCELSQVGGLLDSKGYGIAMRKSEFLKLCSWADSDILARMLDGLDRSKNISRSDISSNS